MAPHAQLDGSRTRQHRTRAEMTPLLCSPVNGGDPISAPCSKGSSSGSHPTEEPGTEPGCGDPGLDRQSQCFPAPRRDGTQGNHLQEETFTSPHPTPPRRTGLPLLLLPLGDFVPSCQQSTVTTAPIKVHPGTTACSAWGGRGGLKKSSPVTKPGVERLREDVWGLQPRGCGVPARQGALCLQGQVPPAPAPHTKLLCSPGSSGCGVAAGGSQLPPG